MRMSPAFLSFLIAAAAAVFSIESARAANPTGLDLKKSGDITIATDSLPDMEIRVEVKEVSHREWGKTEAKEKYQPTSGTDIERLQTYGFPDGSEIKHAVKVKIQGSEVKMSAEWSSGSAAGFSRVDLWIPQELSEDMIVTLGDKKVFPTDEGKNLGVIKNTDTLVFKRKSSGEFLFTLSGDYFGVFMGLVRDHPEMGLTIRIGNVPLDIAATIGDATQMSWTLGFKP